MKKHAVLAIIAGLLATAAPLAAGTVYLPVVSLEKPADGTYKTRVWITNYGNTPATVKLLYLPGIADGTSARGNPETRTIAPGTTTVLFDSGGPGLLEIEAPDEVAVSAELRNTVLPGPREVFGAVPVVGSRELIPAGETMLLQGLRRSQHGVRSHLGLMNLGHEVASCSASIHAVGGDELVGADELPLPPLSHALLEDVVALTGIVQVGDLNARISCDQPFYAYVAIAEEPTAEVVFVRPSPTGASTLEPPGEPPPPPPPASPKSYVYNLSGTFHTPTKAKPTVQHYIPAPKNRAFKRIVVDLDVTLGAWHPGKNKNHSLFWLHRGPCCWPPWKENIVGFVNAFGPSSYTIRAVHNVDFKHEDVTRRFDRKLQLKPGQTYHVRYDYDAAGGVIRLRISQGGKLLSELTGQPTANRIHSGPSGQFMAYFGHDEPPPGCECGPEVPSYGWKYSNLRVEFID